LIFSFLEQATKNDDPLRNLSLSFAGEGIEEFEI